MDSSELRTYEFQLSQVQTALESDPDNAELQSLRDELSNLIDLTKQLNAGREAQPSASKGKGAEKRETPAPTHKYKPGEECTARYPHDEKWYPARVLTVAGSEESPVYSVVFAKQRTTETLSGSDLRPRKNPPGGSTGNTVSASQPISNIGSARKQPLDDKERERKRLRKEKKTERNAAKNKEQDARQNAWQKFAAKGAKKGYGIAGDKSMFKTPDDPYAKVGVVGAGRGMTQNAQRTRPVFEEQEPTQD